MMKKNKLWQRIAALAVLGTAFALGGYGLTAEAAAQQAAGTNAAKGAAQQKEEESLHLTTEWDKTFPESKEVNHRKVTFHNRYGIELAADLYEPKNVRKGSLAAVAVSGPFGGVKEQASGLYAQELAKRGYHPRSLNSNEGWNASHTDLYDNMKKIPFDKITAFFQKYLK